jgi:hypothetical protein
VIPECVVAAAIGDEIAGLIKLAAFACGAGVASTTSPPIATRPNSFFMVVVLHMRERFTARPERATAVAVPLSSHVLSMSLVASETLRVTT